MTARHVLIAALAVSLSACAWLPWSHRRPVRPATPASAPAPTVARALPPAPAASTATVAPPRTVPPKTYRPAPQEPPPRIVPAKRPVAAPTVAAAAAPAPVQKPPAPERTPPAASEAIAPRRGNDLHGELRLQAGRGQQLHEGEAIDTVVYFVPDGGAPAPRPRRHDVVTAHRDFRPTAIAVPLGSTLSYVNRDTVRHNVFSVTPGAAFNLGYQPAGTRDDHVFGTAGLVLVNCNVHHTMEMDVLVVPSPYASRVAADGSFALHGLPDGPGHIVAWNPRARLLRKPISLPSKTPVSLRLLAERPRVVTEIDVGSRP